MVFLCHLYDWMGERGKGEGVCKKKGPIFYDGSITRGQERTPDAHALSSLHTPSHPN